MAHRQLAMESLKERAANGRTPDKRIESLLMAGANDSDASVRELALGALAEQKSSLLLPAAAAQLHNPDPQIRLLGLRYLARANARLALPLLMPLLDDPDLRVVTSVESALRRWTGLDYAVRIVQAIPKHREDGQESPVTSDLQAIKTGIDRRKAWWALHQNEYPSEPVAQAAQAVDVNDAGGPALDFTLRDLSGRFVSLSAFRGNVYRFRACIPFAFRLDSGV